MPTRTSTKCRPLRSVAGFVLALGLIAATPASADLVPASSPIPVDARAYIEPVGVLLHWTPPVGNPSPIDGYHVYLDADESEVNPGGSPAFDTAVSPSDAPSWPVPAALARDTAYFWRVDTEFTDATTATGTVWSFTTERIDIPGTVVDYSTDPQDLYLMSPSITRLNDDTLIASHDISGAHAPSPTTTAVFESRDEGVNWVEISRVSPLHWANLFVHDGDLYLMGITGSGGSKCVIYRSDDGGYTWTDPVDDATGLLFPDTKYHTAPVPVAIHNGRIWRAMEDYQDPGDWATYFRSFMMSAPVDADLLDAASWTSTNRLSFDEDTWVGTGWLEGNAVVTPDGHIVNILRVAGSIPSLFVVETAAVVSISDDGLTASFDPATDFIEFPGGGVKFTIRYDEETGLYWSLVNKQRRPYAMRNRLSITSSPDLVDWTVRGDLLWSLDPVFHAWQYVDWIFDGDDILFLSRTAHPMGGGVLPHGYHDANFSTFHRVEEFRDILGDDDDIDDDTDDDTDDDVDDDADDDDVDDPADGGDDDADDDLSDVASAESDDDSGGCGC